MSVRVQDILPEALVEELMADDLLPEYDIDYSRARPNRFAARLTEVRMVGLSPSEVAEGEVE